MIPWVVLAACLFFPLPFSKTLVETAPAPPETGVSDVSSWTTTPSLSAAAGGDTAPPSSSLETNSSRVVTLSSNSFLVPSAAASGHRETKMREAGTATPTTTVLGQEGGGSAPNRVTTASTQRANRVVVKPEGGATDHVMSGKDLSSSLYQPLTFGAASNAVSRGATAGSSMQSTQSSTGSPIKNFIYSRAAAIGGAADPWVSKALSTILNSVSLIVENALNNSAGGGFNSSSTTADNVGILSDGISSPSEPKIENRDDVFGNNSLSLLPSPGMTSNLPLASTTTKMTTTLKTTSLPTVTSKTNNEAARTLQPTSAQSSTTTAVTRPSTTSPASTKVKTSTTTTSLRTSASTHSVKRPNPTTPTTATTSFETMTLDAVASTAVEDVTTYNVIVTLDTVTTADISMSDTSTIPDEINLPDVTSLPDTTILPDTTSLQDTTTIPDITDLPDTTSLQDTTTIPDITTLPDTTSLQDTTTIPDITDLPDTTSLQDTTTIPDITDLPDTTSLQDTTTIPDITTFADTTNLLDSTTLADTTLIPDITTFADTTTLPSTAQLPYTTSMTDTTTIPITVNSLKITTIPVTPTPDLTTRSNTDRKAMMSLEAQTTTNPPRKQDLIIFLVNYPPGLTNGYLSRNGTAVWTNRFAGLPSARRLPPALTVFVNRLKEQQSSHTQEPDRLPTTPPPNPSPPVWAGESPRERSPGGEAFIRPSDGKSSAQAPHQPAEGGFTSQKKPLKKTNEAPRPVPRDPEARKFFFHELLAEIIRRHWGVLDPWERHRRRQEDMARRQQAQLKADKMVSPPFRVTSPREVIPTTHTPDARAVFTEKKTPADINPRQVFVHAQLHTDPESVPVLVVPSGADQRQQFFRIFPKGDSVGKVIPSSNGNQPNLDLPTSQNWLSQLFQSMTDFGRRVSITVK